MSHRGRLALKVGPNAPEGCFSPLETLHLTIEQEMVALWRAKVTRICQSHAYRLLYKGTYLGDEMVAASGPYPLFVSVAAHGQRKE